MDRHDLSATAGRKLKPLILVSAAAAALTVQAGPAQASPLVYGQYHCSSPGSARLETALKFRADATYVNGQGRAGTYGIDRSGLITFTAGPWEGYYAQVLPDGTVSLSTRISGQPYRVCQRR